jgi:hypothetical protein
MPEALSQFIAANLASIGKHAVSAYVEVITEESNNLYETLKRTTPMNTGGLKASLSIKSVRKGSRFGFVVSYEGYNEKGVPYARIANTLNSGTKSIRATRHINRAIRLLKGIDDRIQSRYLEKIKQSGV